MTPKPEPHPLLINMQKQLQPLFDSLGASGEPQIHKSCLCGSFEVEPGGTRTDPKGNYAVSYTAFTKPNGVMFFAIVYTHESWRKRDRLYPETEQISHGEKYTHWFPISKHPPKWIGVNLYYGPKANQTIVEEIKKVVELQKKELHNM